MDDGMGSGDKPAEEKPSGGSCAASVATKIFSSFRTTV